MRWVGALVAGALLFVETSAVHGQQIELGTPDRAASAKRQHVDLLTDAVEVTAGKPQEVELRFRVEPGFHINSHTPKDELLIPTVLRFEDGKVHVSEAQYPHGTTYHLPIAGGEDLDVYQGEFRVRMRVVAPAGATVMTGALHYQACDNAACFPPRTLPLKIALTAR